jgi:hypothetical protein
MPDARGGTPFVRVAAYQRAATTIAGINGVSAAGVVAGIEARYRAHRRKALDHVSLLVDW